MGLKHKIVGVYHPYANCMEKGYSFGIELSDHIKISGENYETREDRDEASKEIAEELNISLVNNW